jgi:hypothetical protein
MSKDITLTTIVSVMAPTRVTVRFTVPVDHARDDQLDVIDLADAATVRKVYDAKAADDLLETVNHTEDLTAQLAEYLDSDVGKAAIRAALEGIDQ